VQATATMDASAIDRATTPVDKVGLMLFHGRFRFEMANCVPAPHMLLGGDSLRRRRARRPARSLSTRTLTPSTAAFAPSGNAWCVHVPRHYRLFDTIH